MIAALYLLVILGHLGADYATRESCERDANLINLYRETPIAICKRIKS